MYAHGRTNWNQKADEQARWFLNQYAHHYQEVPMKPQQRALIKRTCACSGQVRTSYQGTSSCLHPPSPPPPSMIKAMIGEAEK